tara:strand:- start:197 stop:616 length:420 start_codon:yes stop_codon:yes gene_type:complete
MGVYGDMPGAGLTALLQDRKEKLMSKKDDDIISLENVNGISSSDITVTVNGLDTKLVEDAWTVDNNLVSGAYSTDTITLNSVDLNTDMSSAVTLNEILYDDFNGGKTVTVDLRQGDLFNGWPEDGEPDPDTITITTLKE